MSRNRLENIVNSHYKFFHFCSKIYNGLSFKNKLRSKGCKVSLGVSNIKGLKIKNYGHNNEVIIGDFAKIQNSTIILYGNNNRILLNDRSFLVNVEFYTEDDNNEIVIGSHTSFFGNAHLAAIEGTKIIIGDNCMFAKDVHFRTGDSHSILNMQGERINESKDIIIDDHVWFGTKVTCLKGVHVSKDSIVAATTTLNKEYNVNNVIIGGVPGKIIKTDVNWAEERIPINKSK